MRGRVGGWVLASPLRGLFQKLLIGEVIEDVLALVGPEATAVDCGAGSGYYTLRAVRKASGGRAVAVDSSGVMLSLLVKRKRRARGSGTLLALEADAVDLPLSDGVADAAFSTAVFHELSDPQAALIELLRVLRVGGRVLVADFAADSFMGRHVVGKAHHGHGPWVEGELAGLMADAGFTEVCEQRRRGWIVAVGVKG